MKRIKTFKLFESNEFGDAGFKSDIRHIKMIMSDIKDDGIDFRVIPGERDFPDEKDNIYIKIFNIPRDLKNQLDYFERKYKQLIDEIGDLYKLTKVRVSTELSHSDTRQPSFESIEDFYQWVNEINNKFVEQHAKLNKMQDKSEKEGIPYKVRFESIDFEFSSHDGKDVF